MVPAVVDLRAEPPRCAGARCHEGGVTCNVINMAVRHRVSAYRERMRAQGLRPVQIWVPDVRSPEFAAEAHRQSVLVASSASAIEDMDFVEAVSEDWAE